MDGIWVHKVAASLDSVCIDKTRRLDAFFLEEKSVCCTDFITGEKNDQCCKYLVFICWSDTGLLASPLSVYSIPYLNRKKLHVKPDQEQGIATMYRM